MLSKKKLGKWKKFISMQIIIRNPSKYCNEELVEKLKLTYYILNEILRIKQSFITNMKD